MNRRVVWQDRAPDDLASLRRRDRRAVERISDAVDALAEDNTGDVRKLTSAAGQYRLRVGSWRVLFTFEDRGETILVRRVLRRNEGTYR